MFKRLFLALLLTSSVAVAQQPQKPAPVLHQVSNQQLVQSVYPDAAKVEKVNSYWYKVVNKENVTLGFAMSSANYCKNVKGYNNTTPIMVITDKNFVIKKVALLSNYETPSYVRRLEKNGFFNSWVGKKIGEAKSAQVDGFTGATYTANAVRKNMDFLLKNGAKKLPKKA